MTIEHALGWLDNIIDYTVECLEDSEGEEQGHYAYILDRLNLIKRELEP